MSNMSFQEAIKESGITDVKAFVQIQKTHNIIYRRFPHLKKLTGTQQLDLCVLIARIVVNTSIHDMNRLHPTRKVKFDPTLSILYDK